jgi:hypothetical protein
MSLEMQEPRHVDEPQEVQEYADMLSEVAAEHQSVIVRRGGADLAAVVPLEFLELAREAIARQEAERIAATIDWDHLVRTSPPPQSWFDNEEPKPF